MTCFRKTNWNIEIFIVTGFSDELALPGSVGACTAVSTVTTYGIQRLRCLGRRHGGVQDVLPAESHKTTRLLLQLHRCEYLGAVCVFNRWSKPDVMLLLHSEVTGQQTWTVLWLLSQWNRKSGQYKLLLSCDQWGKQRTCTNIYWIKFLKLEVLDILVLHLCIYMKCYLYC